MAQSLQWRQKEGIVNVASMLAGSFPRLSALSVPAARLDQWEK